jgi:hypothetical protein
MIVSSLGSSGLGTLIGPLIGLFEDSTCWVGVASEGVSMRPQKRGSG